MIIVDGSFRFGATFVQSFSPDDVTGLVAWYDFSDISTLWQDTARTSPVTADGQAIKGVTDKSGNGYHLSNNVTPPTYKEAIVNGKSTALFDGSNDYFDVATTAFSAFSLFTVAKVLDTSNFKGFISTHGTSGDDYNQANCTAYSYISSVMKVSTLNNTSAGASYTLGEMDSAFKVLSAAMGSSDDTLNAWMNGTQVQTNGNIKGRTSNVVGGITIGTRFASGAPDSSYGNVHFAHILVYDSALVTGDVDSIESFLGSEYGITIA